MLPRGSLRLSQAPTTKAPMACAFGCACARYACGCDEVFYTFERMFVCILGHVIGIDSCQWMKYVGGGGQAAPLGHTVVSARMKPGDWSCGHRYGQPQELSCRKQSAAPAVTTANFPQPHVRISMNHRVVISKSVQHVGGVRRAMPIS
mmetsp:Transcript_49589/g.80890  ORF Transcript_49589/g.80890 Transcript_49589/m.80890 type:complete len:148 (+) Transcript_49589:86-529(+)